MKLRYKCSHSNEAYAEALEIAKKEKMYEGSMTPLEVMKWYDEQVKFIAKRVEPVVGKYVTGYATYAIQEKATAGLTEEESRKFRAWEEVGLIWIGRLMENFLVDMLSNAKRGGKYVLDRDAIYGAEPVSYDELLLTDEIMIERDEEIQAKFTELYEEHLAKLAEHKEYHKAMLVRFNFGQDYDQAHRINLSKDRTKNMDGEMLIWIGVGILLLIGYASFWRWL